MDDRDLPEIENYSRRNPPPHTPKGQRQKEHQLNPEPKERGQTWKKNIAAAENKIRGRGGGRIASAVAVST